MLRRSLLEPQLLCAQRDDMRRVPPQLGREVFICDDVWKVTRVGRRLESDLLWLGPSFHLTFKKLLPKAQMTAALGVRLGKFH